jgi:GGDEF domain-containing protein
MLPDTLGILNHKNIIPVPVGIAYGYAVFTADDTDPEKVRERADEDMYRNKKAMKQS